ncbi:MAG: hydrolase TatD [Planctomycetota bacterium]|nr:MAG: hydrolase TatD [Planctomycetota bacterium]
MNNDCKEFLIDIGANLTSKKFNTDLDDVIQRAQEQKVNHIILTGTSIKSSLDALALAKSHNGLFSCTAGVHPHEAKHWNEEIKNEIVKLVADNLVVAVGECGLDFNRNFSSKEDQEKCFIQQLEIATQIKKPVFLHERDAHTRFIEILKDFRNQLPGVVVHCYTGNLEQLKAYLDIDCHIGITGWICDKKRGDQLRAIVKHIPENRLMIETDAPYLTPHNVDKKPKGGRNEPSLLPYVVKQLVESRNQTASEIINSTTNTAIKFFGLNSYC